MSINQEPLTSADAELLARDMVSVLLNWAADAALTTVFAQEVEQMRSLVDRFARAKSANRYKYKWTSAIYLYFRLLADNPGRIGYEGVKWLLFPKDRPYRGEFLTDFAIWEHGYGLRIACESQWHEGKNNKTRVASGLDKLLHVRADLKILIFEDQHSTGNLLGQLHSEYLTKYLKFDTSEKYILFQWDREAVRVYLWSSGGESAPTLLKFN